MHAPGVVLVHGIRASRTMWRSQLAALERAGVPARAPDLPGHGAQAGQDFTVDGAVSAVEDAAAELGGPVLVVGLSLGGYLAIYWAARTERPLAGLLAAGCSTRPRGAGLAAYRRVAAVIARLPDGGRRLNDALARVALPSQARADLAEGGMEMGVMATALAEVGTIDPIADLRSLGRLPVWLVNGRWDHFRIEERRFLAACENATLHVVPGANHMVSLSRPAAFNEILLAFVDRLRLDRPGRPDLSGPGAGSG